jgi:hypothetical protein
MSEPKKVLWVVNYDTLKGFVERATSVKATAVAIRTDNDLASAISAFHDKGIEVYGWRWPSAMRDPALKEADKAAGLLAKGLDGYYVDPEGAKGKPYDWDQNGLEKLAADFCKLVRSGAPDKPFGTTSHYRGKKVHGKLPWASFFKYSTVLLPQAYWRFEDGDIGHGIPGDNYRASLDFWESTGAPRNKIVPMGGSLGYVTAAEINAYVKEAKAQKIPSLHFYAAREGVNSSVWNAIANASVDT